MRARTTWLLALAALLLGLALLLDETTLPAPATTSLLPVPPHTVSSIQIERPGETVRLVKEAGSWRIIEPLHAFADQQRVEVLLDTLALPRQYRPVEGGESTPEQFGLEPPLATVRIATASRALPAIFLGRQTPIGDNAYIRIEDRSEILLSSADIPFAANRGVDDLRSRKLLTQKKPPTELRIRRPNLPTIILRQVDGKWLIAEPYRAPASDAAVAGWIAAVENLEANSFFQQPSPQDLLAYGFSPAALAIEWIDAKGTEPHRLWIGGPNLRAGDDEVWVRTNQVPTLFSVSRAKILPVDITPEALRDKSLTGFRPEHIQALVLQREGQSEIRLERDGAEWLANRQPANRSVAEGYLADALALSGQQTLSTAGGSEHFGLDRPELVLTLEGASGETLARLLVSESTGTRAIHREGTQLVYSLTGQQQVTLEKKLSDFR